jgi:uncharacterized protein
MTQPNRPRHRTTEVRAGREVIEQRRQLRTAYSTRADKRTVSVLTRTGAPVGPVTADPPTVAGNAMTGSPIVYGVPYTVTDSLGTFTETISPRAATSSLQRGDDVRLLVNHDQNSLPLARVSSGTLTLTDTPAALRFVAQLDPANPHAAAVLSAVGRGDVSQMSFGFIVGVGNDSWSPDYTQRTISGFEEIMEVSIVNWPANPATSVSLASKQRSAEQIAWHRTVDRAYSDYEKVSRPIMATLRSGATLSTVNANALKAAHNKLSAVLQNAGHTPPGGWTGAFPEPDAGPDGTEGGSGPVDSQGMGNGDGTGVRTALELELELLQLQRKVAA